MGGCRWRRSACKDKYEDDCFCSLVDGSSEVSKSLLSGRVPNLQFDAVALEVDGLHLEVDADGGHVGLVVVCVDVAQQQVGLADCGVADDCDFGH